MEQKATTLTQPEEYPRDRADSSKVKTWGTAAVEEVKQFHVCRPSGRDSHGSPAVRNDEAFRKSYGLIREVGGSAALGFGDGDPMRAAMGFG